jgi:hypothetical protein
VTRPVVIDDAVLARVIASGAPHALEGVSGAVICTGFWWYRLASAVLDTRIEGRLSALFADLDPETRRALVSELPDDVAIRGLSALAPAAAGWARRARTVGIHLNALAAEAIAVVLDADGELVVGSHSPSLAAAAAEFGVAYRVIEP